MRYTNEWRVAVLFAACLPLAACGAVSEAAESDAKAIKIEQIEGTDLSRLTLTAHAAQRLDLQTAPVQSVQVKGTQRKVIPYAAILYDTEGKTWAYTSPESLVFVRAFVLVDYVEGDLAVLSAGPPIGTKVVTVGAVELYGSEIGRASCRERV